MEPLVVGTVLIVGSLVGIVTLGLPPFTALALIVGIEFGFAGAVHSDAVEPAIEQVAEEPVEIAEK